MKNFGVRYPVDGTSALQPKFSHAPFDAGNIIEFPGVASREGHAERDASKRCRMLDSEIARTLRFGTARGRAYDRIAPWQATVVGVLFAGAAFLVLILGS